MESLKGVIERELVREGGYFYLTVKILFKWSFAFSLCIASIEKSVLATTKVYTYYSKMHI